MRKLYQTADVTPAATLLAREQKANESNVAHERGSPAPVSQLQKSETKPSPAQSSSFQLALSPTLSERKVASQRQTDEATPILERGNEEGDETKEALSAAKGAQPVKEVNQKDIDQEYHSLSTFIGKWVGSKVWKRQRWKAIVELS